MTQPGFYSLADLPQRLSIGQHAINTGWWELDQVLRFYLGQFLVVTGIAGHGKSTFMLNLICNLARRSGIASFLYVPENEAHLREKLRALWAKDDGTFEYFSSNQCWIQSAIPDDYDDRPRTLPWVLEKAILAIERHRVQFVLIDPWNELERAKPRDMLLTDYIGECLMLLKMFCRKFNVIVCIIAHPTKAVNENGGRTATLADIEGSMNWFNKCDNGLICVRDPNRPACRVISAKVRELGAGKVGSCWFRVDPQSGIFTPDHGGVTT